ncbi:MBL fold metallo-hydrolase [Prevotella sp.]
MILQRTFHPVGQGAFYTERHKISNGKDFTIVYDCGSFQFTNLKNRIKSAFQKGEEIDILFISHFHVDHINGIKELKERCKIKRVILPLLDEKTKYILKINNYLAKNYKDTTLIDNPKRFFDEETSIIQIEEEGYQDHRVNPDEIEDINRLNNIDKKKSGTVFSYDKSLSYKDQWLFIPFNYKQEDRFNLFNKLLKEEYPYIPLNKLDDIKIIEKYEAELKKIYKKINGDLNVTSMILFSGSIKPTPIRCWNIPIKPHPSQYYEYYSCPHDFKYLNYEYRIPSGCLYTGDINLKKDENIVKEIKSRLRLQWKSIGTIQIPHHGSIHNFSEEIISKAIKCAIISFGTTNTFGHPSDKIMGDILSKNIALYLVTENIETMVIQRK